MSTLHKTIGTTTGNLTMNCTRRDYRGADAKIVLVASDNLNVQNWIYKYLTPYADKGYGFVFVERELDFLEYARRFDTVMAFIEDMFFGEHTLGKLENLKKDYPRLRLTVFSAANLPSDIAARYVCWSDGNFMSLRSGEKAINKTVLSVFNHQLTYPSSLIKDIKKYTDMSGKNPYLTQREFEVVRCFSEGKNGKEVAKILCVSERTVRSHTRNIYRKFGISKIGGVIKAAISNGLLPANIEPKKT